MVITLIVLSLIKWQNIFLAVISGGSHKPEMDYQLIPISVFQPSYYPINPVGNVLFLILCLPIITHLTYLFSGRACILEFDSFSNL